MATVQITIVIESGELVLEANQGDSLYTLLLVNGVLQDGTAVDRIKLEKGSVSTAANAAAEEAVFSPAELADGWMLASERKLSGDAIFSLLAEEPPASAAELAQPARRGMGLAVEVGLGTMTAGLVDLEGLQIPAMSVCHSGKAVAYQGADFLPLADSLAEDILQAATKLTVKTGLQLTDISAVMLAAISPGLNAAAEAGGFLQQSAAEAGLTAFSPDTQLCFLPEAPPFDSSLIASLLACDLGKKSRREGLTVLVDFGLNTEILIAGRERILAALVHTPPFGGRDISHGVQVSTGAITKVRIEEDILLDTVRDACPSGLCGAGLVSAADALLQNGLLDSEGRLLLPAEAPPKVAARFRSTMDGREILLSPGAGAGKEIYLVQNDIRQLQLAKANIYAALVALLQAFEAEEEEIEQLILAEDFGERIDIGAALAIGLLPRLPLEKISISRNAAWQGAYLVLSSRHYLQEAVAIAAKLEHLDLAADLLFADTFIGAMNFDN